MHNIAHGCYFECSIAQSKIYCCIDKYASRVLLVYAKTIALLNTWKIKGFIVFAKCCWNLHKKTQSKSNFFYLNAKTNNNSNISFAS